MHPIIKCGDHNNNRVSNRQGGLCTQFKYCVMCIRILSCTCAKKGRVDVMVKCMASRLKSALPVAGGRRKLDPMFGRGAAFVTDSLVSGMLAKHRQSAILNELRTDGVLVRTKFPPIHLQLIFLSISERDQCMGQDEAPPTSSTHSNEVQ